MENKSFNDNPTSSLLNINKINGLLNNKTDFKTLTNIKENTIENLQLSLEKIDQDKNIEQKDDLKETNNIKDKDIFSSLRTLKSIKIINTSNNPKNNKSKNEESLHNLFKSDSTKIKNNLKTSKKNMKSINLQNFYKSKSIKFISLSKKNHPLSKFSLYKKNKNDFINDNNIVKEEEDSNKKNKFFSTEIILDNTNTNTNENNKIKTKINTNANINNYININNDNNNFQKKSSSDLDLMENLNKDNLNNYNNKTKEDPLLIPKEDMIFEEIKKYKCFKYFTEEELKKTGVPFIYIQMNMNTNKDLKNINKKNNIDKSLTDNKFLQKLLKTGKDKIFLSKRYNKDLTDEKKKEILNNIYRVKTSPDFYKKIENIKGKKERKKLKNYQNYFLKLVKHNITNKYYESLKDKFIQIRDVAEGKYNTNYKFIKEMEKNEEDAINNINDICNKYKKYFSHRNINKLFIKSIGPRLKLPKIKFVQIAKKNYFSNDEKNNKKKYNSKKYMSRTCNKFNKGRSLNEIYKDLEKDKDVSLSNSSFNRLNILKSNCSKNI